MAAAIDIFINGISGVFLGMAVLYLAMKLIAVIATERTDSEQRD